MKLSLPARRVGRYVVVLLLVTALAGCGSVTVTQNAATSLGGPGSAGGGTSSGGAAVGISGSPPATTLVGKTISFQPKASDSSGNKPHFSITGQPSWASFDPATGVLSGKPSAADVGSYKISIVVSDGSHQASLSFTLDVMSVGTGRATVSWISPLRRADGAPLQNLAGFRIYYGTQPNLLDSVVDVGNPGAVSVVVENLTPGTWYFAATAIDASGLESALSQSASKTI